MQCSESNVEWNDCENVCQLLAYKCLHIVAYGFYTVGSSWPACPHLTSFMFITRERILLRVPEFIHSEAHNSDCCLPSNDPEDRLQHLLTSLPTFSSRQDEAVISRKEDNPLNYSTNKQHYSTYPSPVQVNQYIPWVMIPPSRESTPSQPTIHLPTRRPQDSSPTNAPKSLLFARLVT